ncbi:retrotransposon protein, putative, ty1-copia subclass, partial [Tanacetum coccineum]
VKRSTKDMLKSKFDMKDMGLADVILGIKIIRSLKQAPKQWHQKFDHTMLESGFKINECDKCVYVKDTSAGYVILCLYVDDMLMTDILLLSRDTVIGTDI